MSWADSADDVDLFSAMQGLLAAGVPPSTLQALLSGLAANSGEFPAGGLENRTLASLLASGALGAQNIAAPAPKVTSFPRCRIGAHFSQPCYLIRYSDEYEFLALCTQNTQYPMFGSNQQQPSAITSSLLGGLHFSSPPAAIPARPLQGFGGINNLTDPMAAVYANVNQNLSPTGASLLTPWGIQPGQQVHASESHEPTSPTAASDISDYPTSKIPHFPSTVLELAAQIGRCVDGSKT